MTQKTVPLKTLFEEAYKKNRKRTRKPPKRRNSHLPTGFVNVKRGNCSKCKKGKLWYYSYKVDGKRKTISSVDFLTLRVKIKNKNMKWHIEDEYYARKTAKIVGLPLGDLR